MTEAARPGPEITDAEVVRRVLAGDVEAFAMLVARYQAACLRFATRMLDDSADAEDAVQTAFVRAYSALGRYEERSRFSAWLFAIVVNECRVVRAGRARRERFTQPDDGELAEAVDEQGDSTRPDDDRLDRIERELRTLEPLLREAFLMRYVDDMDYEEMGRITGAGKSALKMRVKRACDALRTRLGRDAND